MKAMFLRHVAAAMVLVAVPTVAKADSQQLQLQPLIDVRTRLEDVRQDNMAERADAVTTRVIAGVQATDGPVTVLVEGIGLLAIDDHYNSSTNGHTQYPLVTDPQNIALHSLQLRYRVLPTTAVTVGRQYIVLDDERFVGASPWRQNEQVYDAVRLQSEPVHNLKLDLNYGPTGRSTASTGPARGPAPCREAAICSTPPTRRPSER